MKCTNCISTEVQDSHPNECPAYDTKRSDSEVPAMDMTLNDLIVRFQYNYLGNAEYSLITIAPRFTLTRSGSTW